MLGTVCIFSFLYGALVVVPILCWSGHTCLQWYFLKANATELYCYDVRPRDDKYKISQVSAGIYLGNPHPRSNVDFFSRGSLRERIISLFYEFCFIYWFLEIFFDFYFSFLNVAFHMAFLTLVHVYDLSFIFQNFWRPSPFLFRIMACSLYFSTRSSSGILHYNVSLPPRRLLSCV